VSSLRAKDFQTILAILYLVNDDQGELEVSQQVLSELGALVGCESVSYSHVEHNPQRRLLHHVHEPFNPNPTKIPGFSAVIGQHPVFATQCSSSGQAMVNVPIALTDVATVRTLRRLELYVDFHEPCGVNDQLIYTAQWRRGQCIGFAFNRTRLGFSNRDRAAVELVARHLSQSVAYRRRVAALSAAVRSLSRHADQINQARPRLSSLTSREREIVEHLMGGVTDREIARTLLISTRTVHKHLESIYRKLGIGSRTSLMTLLHQTNEIVQHTADHSIVA
jgi:DNA-binding CsgD family transcriptional regulator